LNFFLCQAVVVAAMMAAAAVVAAEFCTIKITM
jgi:hypothetical protein